MNTNDDPIDEIREIRRLISKEFGHNSKRYIDYLKNIKGDYTTQTNSYDNSPNNRLNPTLRKKPRKAG